MSRFYGIFTADKDDKKRTICSHQWLNAYINARNCGIKVKLYESDENVLKMEVFRTDGSNDRESEKLIYEFTYDDKQKKIIKETKIK